MNIPSRSNRNKVNLAYRDKLDQREEWHKLVVKVLWWKGGLFEGGTVTLADKITKNEWNLYCEGILKINAVQGKEKIMEKLGELRKIINKFGGFKA